jgi:sterol desaturase/sphingolipid hydroxylase (fatty acid hydroxylase superfamily)
MEETMKAEDIAGLMIPVTWLVMMGVEAFGTGRSWPAIRLWRTRSFAFFIMVMTINAVLPGLLPASVTSHHLLDVGNLGVLPSVVIGYLMLSLATALVHRAYHRFDPLWRWIHQLHHSPIRMDVAGAVVFTPWEILVNVAVFQVVVVFVLGIDPLSAAILGYVSVFYALFQHFNVHTPKWLGYLIQRPESHSVHHRRGMHAYNYSDLPIWDILMGTFRNPAAFHGEVGFEPQADARIAPMFVGHDANLALYGPGSRGSVDPATNPA